MKTMVSVGDSSEVYLLQVIDGGREFKRIGTYSGRPFWDRLDRPSNQYQLQPMPDSRLRGARTAANLPLPVKASPCMFDNVHALILQQMAR